MTPREFDVLTALLKKRSGLALTRDKEYLLESRLKSVARKHGHASLAGLVRVLAAGGAPEALLCEITEAMTTNESMFFRDNKPFLSLRQKALPALVPQLAGRPLNIWSAACSHGQEPYSIAITLDEEKAKLAGCGYAILATDIDGQVLKKAEEGVYTQFEVQRGLPIQMLLKYFVQRDSNTWKVKDDVKKHIQFRRYNLLDSFSSLGTFDVIMCRNVLIYFDEATKRQVLARLAATLSPYGVLFLGSTETILGICDALKPVAGEPGIYIRRESTLTFSAAP